METTQQNGLSAKERARISGLISRHEAIIQRAKVALATDFDTPAQRTIGAACHAMGCTRLDWEKIVAVQNGWDFAPVPKHILARWETY